jgi:hypothetical protein
MKFDQTAFVPARALAFPRIERTTVGNHVPAWLALWEAGWSFKKIADAWTTTAHPVTPDHVEAVLNKASMSPSPTIRTIPRLPQNQKQALAQRSLIKRLYREGWSVESLVQRFFYYSPEVVKQIVGSPVRKSRAKLSPRRKCPCGCVHRVTGRKKYATDACRKRVARRSSDRPI